MAVHRRGLALTQVKGRRVLRAGCLREGITERRCVAEGSGAQASQGLQLVQGRMVASARLAILTLPS